MSRAYDISGSEAADLGAGKGPQSNFPWYDNGYYWDPAQVILYALNKVTEDCIYGNEYAGWYNMKKSTDEIMTIPDYSGELGDLGIKE